MCSPPLLSRRQALQYGVTGLTVASCRPWFEQSALAIPPIVRVGTSKLKLSLAAYSYRDLLTGNSPSLTLEDFISDCAQFGIDGVELTSYYFPESITPEYLAQLKGLCFRHGLNISGTAIRNDFCVPPGDARDAELQHVKRWIEYAEAMDAPVIRIFAGQVQAGQNEAEAHRLMVAGIEACCQIAGERGIYLALENHGGPTATAEGLLKIVRDVKSPWFGVNLDTGNFHSDDIYGDLAKVATYATNVQVKIVTSGPDGVKRPADYARICTILKDCGYCGYLVLEFEEQGNPRVECRQHLDLLASAISKVTAGNT